MKLFDVADQEAGWETIHLLTVHRSRKRNQFTSIIGPHADFEGERDGET